MRFVMTAAACGTSIKHYICGNDNCPHVKYLCNICHCRACPSCGKKKLLISESPTNTTAYPIVLGNPWSSRCPIRYGRYFFITASCLMPCAAWPSITYSMPPDAEGRISNVLRHPRL